MDRSNTICDLENWRYNGVDIEKHKPKAFLDYQKPGKHPYGNKIEVRMDIYKALNYYKKSAVIEYRIFE